MVIKTSPQLFKLNKVNIRVALLLFVSLISVIFFSLCAPAAHLVPGVAQVVPVGVGHGDQRLDGVDVLLLHLRDAGARRQQREAGQRLDVRVSLQLRAGRPGY